MICIFLLWNKSLLHLTEAKKKTQKSSVPSNFQGDQKEEKYEKKKKQVITKEAWQLNAMWYFGYSTLNPETEKDTR